MDRKWLIDRIKEQRGAFCIADMYSINDEIFDDIPAFERFNLKQLWPVATELKSGNKYKYGGVFYDGAADKLIYIYKKYCAEVDPIKALEIDPKTLLVYDDDGRVIEDDEIFDCVESDYFDKTDNGTMYVHFEIVD